MVIPFFRARAAEAVFLVHERRPGFKFKINFKKVYITWRLLTDFQKIVPCHATKMK